MDTQQIGEEYARWRFLLEHPPVTRQGWLPPSTDVPELDHLNAEHERLLALVEEQDAARFELTAKHDAELEAQRAAQEASFLGTSSGKKPPKITITDAALAEAKEKSAIARDALQTFTEQAIAEIKELIPDLHAGITKILKRAEAKYAKAKALESDARQLEGSTKKLSNWLGRFDGTSKLGLIAWDDLDVPMPRQPQTIADVYGETHPHMGMVESDDVDPITGSSAFGTDDPENLYADDHAHEIALHVEVANNAL